MIKNELKHIRDREYGYTQREFSKLLGISPSQYNAYEKCKAVPYVELAIIIARKLNKRVEDIFIVPFD